MARSHGRVMAAIWNDADFIAMRCSAQRMFMFLISQPDMSHAGLLPMRVNRWAKKAEDTSAKDIRDDLDYLAARRFVVVDEDTEEVLVRSYVRNDGVYKQPKVMLRLREDARQIESPDLRAVFRAELERLPLHELADATRSAVASVVADLCNDFDDVSAGHDPFERVSERVSGRVSEGVSDTPRVGAGAFPLPPTPFPLPPTPVPPTAGGGGSGAQLALPDEAPTAQSLVAEWIEHCESRPPGRVVGQVAKELKALLDEGIDPDRLRAALAEWNRKGLHPSTLASVVHEIANRRPAARGQQATNDLFDAAMARAIEKDRNAS